MFIIQKIIPYKEDVHQKCFLRLYQNIKNRLKINSYFTYQYLISHVVKI